TAFILARTGSVLDGPPVDPARLVVWGRQAVEVPPPIQPWCIHALGVAHYRAGQYDLAIQRLEESLRAIWTNGNAQNRLRLALAHHRLGHADEARRWLREAITDIDKAARSLPPTDWLEANVLRREAEALIDPKR